MVVRPQSFHDDRGPGEWWVASDLDEIALGGGALAEDHVLGVGGASLTLAGLQLPSPARRVLDLGTGCGIQALRARRYADEVVATDLSARALDYARMNLLIDETDGVELREGSLFEPVAGETFDRIVSNPPFVITPRAARVPEYEYRDGGLVGDALVEQVFAGVGAHLEPGGVAQMLGNWETRDGVGSLDRVRAWVDASPCRWMPGSSSARSSTPSGTPRRGSATAAPCQAAPSSMRCRARGSTISTPAASVRSASDTFCCAGHPVTSRRCGASSVSRSRSRQRARSARISRR